MTASPREIADRLELARAIAQEAGQITLRYFRRDDVEVERKADASPVTIADRQAEQHLRERITAAFADDGILGEEFPEKAGASGFRWILDPLDGTKSFVHGVPLYGTLIGVESGDRSVAGVIEMPALDERIYAAVGEGAWHVSGAEPPVRAQVSACDDLGAALFCTTSVRTYGRLGRGEVYTELEAAAGLTRTWGDCYGYLLVATGRAEVMIDPVMNLWDAAALQPIMEESGGTFTDWRGQRTIHSGEGVATNGHLLEAVLAVTRTAASLA